VVYKKPGLKVVYPAFPYDAKGLLNESINDPNPVLFFEHKAFVPSGLSRCTHRLLHTTTSSSSNKGGK
jgi:pyruvate/2-oxoglutarate/acetoin dehydrogenase E1 component